MFAAVQKYSHRNALVRVTPVAPATVSIVSEPFPYTLIAFAPLLKTRMTRPIVAAGSVTPVPEAADEMTFVVLVSAKDVARFVPTAVKALDTLGDESGLPAC